MVVVSAERIIVLEVTGAARSAKGPTPRWAVPSPINKVLQTEAFAKVAFFLSAILCTLSTLFFDSIHKLMLHQMLWTMEGCCRLREL